LGVQPGMGFPFEAQRSRTKRSTLPFVSPGTRLEAWLAKATKRPSAETDGDGVHTTDAPLPWVSSEATLTRSVTPVRRSWTKTSSAPFVSPLTRLEARLAKATKRPSAEMDASPEKALAWVPSDATLTRSVMRVRRSWTK